MHPSSSETTVQPSSGEFTSLIKLASDMASALMRVTADIEMGHYLTYALQQRLSLDIVAFY